MMLELRAYEPLPSGSQQFPLAFIEQHKALKLKESHKEIWLGQVEPLDELPVWERYFPGKQLNLLPLNEDDFSSFVRRKYPALISQRAHGSTRMEGEGTGGSRDSSIDAALGSPVSSQAAAVNLVNGWIMEGIRTDASDVHLESNSEGGIIRYRRDGVLQSGELMEGRELKRVCNRIKVMAGIDVMESRLPQEGRFSVSIGQEHRDIRVSFLPSSAGVSVVLRLLGAGSRARELHELGFPQDIEDGLRQILQFGQGLFLVTGPTGSGKTTTLNGMLHALPRERMKVISIEDPIEIELSGVVQVQVNESIGLTFSSLLRRVLRQDPDVLMLGEIRDEETAQLAIRASLTGHLVLSSLHTGSVAAVPQRLVNMGVPDYLVASVLRGALSQRLVRTFCGHCSGEGCSQCGELGWHGRQVIGEFLIADPSEGELQNYAEWLRTWCDATEKSLLERGRELLGRAMTSTEELRRLGLQ